MPCGGRVRPTLTCNAVGRHVSPGAHQSCLRPFALVQPCRPGTFIPWPSPVGGRPCGRYSDHRRPFCHRPGGVCHVDFDGNPEGGITSNPCGSFRSNRTVSSPDGRILGKMCHSERSGISPGLKHPRGKRTTPFHRRYKLLLSNKARRRFFLLQKAKDPLKTRDGPVKKEAEIPFFRHITVAAPDL